MPIEQTLEKIERDIASGNQGKARDRLHGLIATYPDDLALRRELGNIYWRLQYPAMAGRYWYLEEDKTPDMLAACEAFEQSCGNRSLQILLSLSFRGDLESIASEFAGNTLRTLQRRAQDEYGYFVDFQKQGASKYRRTQRSRIRDKVAAIGCIAIAVLGIGLMLVGLNTVMDWVF